MYLLTAHNNYDNVVILASFTEKEAAESAQKKMFALGGNSFYVYYADELVYTDTLTVVYVREWEDRLLTRYLEE
jgi:hypothetical protein